MVVFGPFLFLAMQRLAAIGQQRHSVRGDNGLALIAAGVEQARHPALELQAVEHHQVCLGQGPGVGRARGVDVGVAVGADQ